MLKRCCVCVSDGIKSPELSQQRRANSSNGDLKSPLQQHISEIKMEKVESVDKVTEERDIIEPPPSPKVVMFKDQDDDEEDEDDDDDDDDEDDYVIDKLIPSREVFPVEEDEEAASRLEADDCLENFRPPPVRRKSSTGGGILKRPSLVDRPTIDELNEKLASAAKLDDKDDDVFKPGACYPESERLMVRKRSLPAGVLCAAIGRDELALKRHRIFSELVGTARAAVEHKVRFDPLEMVMPAPEKSSSSKNTANNSTAGDFEKLVERLESVVCRLEQVASCLPPGSLLQICPPHPLATLENILPDSPQQQQPSSKMSLAAFQDIVNGPLERYLQCSAGLQHVQEQAALVKKLFQTQLQYLTMASKSSPPSNQNDAIQQLKGHTEGIESVQKFRESNKSSPNFTHLSAISESIPAIGWICVKPTPAPYIKEMNEVGKYYTNRILKDSKGNQQQTNWCVAWTETLTSLEAFVKQYHTTGLVWGGAAGAGGCPPPPPPCPPPCMPPPLDAFDDSGDDRSALFAQINQGADITKSLKKVTSDMQTHKNPTLREGPAPFITPAGAPKPFSKAMPAPGAGQIPAKPPVFARDGKKWLIEYQQGNSGLLVENAEMNNVVYMFRCRDSALTVKGKVNSVVLDSCTKCAVVFDSLVSSVEFVNCQSVQMQVLGKVPTISVDKTDGCQMYLSPDSIDVEIISSKSSEMNVLIPKGNGDYTELPVAEQFKTTFNKGQKSLVTVAVENKG